jgi:hypothetical protein
MLQGVNLLALAATDCHEPNLDLAGGSLTSVGRLEVGPWSLEGTGEGVTSTAEMKRVSLPSAPQDPRVPHRLVLDPSSPGSAYALRWLPEERAGAVPPLPPEESDGTYVLRARKGRLFWEEER